MTLALRHPKAFIWANISYLVTYTNSTPQPRSGKIRKNQRGRKKKKSELSTHNTPHTTPSAAIPSQHVGKILFVSAFHFSLILYFLNGCLDSLLVAQELVRSNGMQVLIQFQENGDSSRKSNVDNVFI